MFDEVLLLGDAGPVACSRAPLHSLASSTAALISFDNQSGRAVRCLWLDWEGNEVPYSVLKPGESSVYSTWKSHAWVVRELEGARRMCLNGAQAIIASPGKQTAAISDAPDLVWQDGTHRAFPRDFQQAVRTLLLCWQRLGGPGSPSCSAAAPHLGSLPLDVVRLLIVQLAPTGLWQDGGAAAHPDVQPVAVCSKRAFRKLCKAAVAQCGRLPAPSRTPVDELLKAPKPAAAQPQGLGARLVQLAQGAGLAMGHMLAGPAQQ